MGLVHIYFGNGKGKTTAAMGLALRALGDGWRVCVCQFLKNAPSGEIEALSRFENAVVLRAGGESTGFLWQMEAAERADYLERQYALLQRVGKENAQMFVLDEAISACQAGAFSAEMLLEAVEALRGRAEVILTGHEAPETLLARADYITQMQKLRHPYDLGVSARRGIEY